MSARFSSFIFTIILAILAFSAMAILYIATPVGAGLANDSVAYIAGARSILQGAGYSDIWLDSTLEPITHYPPLLSLTLSALGLLGIDPQRGTRILNILLFGANTTLMGLLGWRMTRSRIAGLCLAALFMLNATLLRIHVFAMSEPLYIFLSLATFLLFDLSFLFKQKSLWLVLAGIAAGLAILTRYSAIALLPAFSAALLLFQEPNNPHQAKNAAHKTLRARLVSTGLFLAGAAPPIAGWFLRNKLVAGNATNRTFQYHPITSVNIQTGFYNFSQFLMPFEPMRQAIAKSGWWEWILAAFGFILIFWLGLRAWKMLFQGESEAQPQMLTFCSVLYMFTYLGAVLFSMSFFDASTKFQHRILAPIYITFMLLLVTSGTWLWRKNARSPRGRPRFSAEQGCVVSFALLILAVSAFYDIQAITIFQAAGQGYASWKWHDSLVMSSLQKLPPETAIYTNTPPAVYLVTERASRVIPTRIDPVDRLARGDYEQNMAQMRTDLIAGKAVLALFDTSGSEDTLGTENLTEFFAGLTVLEKTQGDILYGSP